MAKQTKQTKAHARKYTYSVELLDNFGVLIDGCDCENYDTAYTYFRYWISICPNYGVQILKSLTEDVLNHRSHMAERLNWKGINHE